LRLSELRESEIERFIGISGYSSRTPGIGGRIKEELEDFLIWEILSDGLDARKAYEGWRGYEEGIGDFTLAVLMKKGIDTIRASTIISRTLKIKPSMLSFCGIKDKMSISWQFITLPRGLIGGEGLRIDEILDVKPLKDVSSKLASRALLKNMFRIRVRGIKPDPETIQECIKELKRNGLPNFYGHQRFGITRPITHLVGKLILEDKLEEAVKLFLAECSPLESERSREARRMLSKSWDFRSALEYFPKNLEYERKVIKYLIENPEDYRGALRSLPLRLRRLMIESVSALLFNKALSKILEEGKLQEPEVGDYVIRLGLIGRPEGGRPIIVNRGNLREVERLINLGKLAIALPVPGYLSSIPRSWKGDVLIEALEDMGISLEMFRVKSIPEASTRGSLRPITVPRWECKIIEYGEDSVLLQVALPPGSYATILLREIMKPKSPLAYIGKIHKRGEYEAIG